MPVKIARRKLAEVGMIDIRSMVIHHVKYYPQAVGVHGLYHFFKLAYAYITIIRVGGIAALGHIIIQRVISPVVLFGIGFGFIYRIKIKRWQYMHMGYTQLFNMIKPGRY